LNCQRRCIAINRESEFLSSELWKLKKKLTLLEINYEAKMKVFKSYNEEKKILKLKKEFTIKRESIVEQQKIMKERIEKIAKDERFEEHIRHNKQWENIKSKIENIPQFVKLLKIYAEMDNSKFPMGIPYSILLKKAQDNGFHEIEVIKIIKYFQDDWDLRNAFIFSEYTKTISSRFTKEIKKL